MTPLDQAHGEMDRDPDDAAARLRFYERLATVELFLLLKDEAEGAKIRPEVFSLTSGDTVMAFDTEERLSDFTGRQTPFAAMSGRRVVELLAGQNLGLGVNLGVAPSSIMLPEDVLDWLAGTLANAAEQVAQRPVELGAPVGIDIALVQALDARLSSAAGLVEKAFLAGVTYEGGRQATLLAFVGARQGAQGALQRGVVETVSFSHREAALDIAFFAPDDPICARLERVGLRFDIPTPAAAEYMPAAPGMDPDKPPKLR